MKPCDGTVSPFFVLHRTGNRTEYVDINTGMVADPLDISYKKAKHGLCKKHGRPVYKKIFNDGFPPLVLIARTPSKQFRHTEPLTMPFMNADKVRAKWEFTPYAIENVLDGMSDGLTSHQLAVRVGAPREAVENLVDRIGGESKNERIISSKTERGGRAGGNGVPARRKDAARRSVPVTNTKKPRQCKRIHEGK